MIRRTLFVVACLTGSAAHAEPPAEVTAEQAIALYREHSPRLAAARAAVDVTAADVVEARIYPNPSVGFTSARTMAGTDTIGGSQHMLAIDVPILIGRQRARREAAAKKHVEATRAEVAVAQGEAELAIRARFAELAVAQDQTAVLTNALVDARSLREIVAGRSSAGAGSAYAVERIDLAIATLASRVEQATALEVAASGELALAVGVPGWHPRAVGGLAAQPAPVTVAPDHPALAADRAARESARADELRAMADAIPTPSLGLQTFGTTDPSGLVAAVGITIPLPLFDRNQGAVARARAEVRRAELTVVARQAELSGELDRATRVLAARRDALARFQADALQRLAKVRTMAETAYRSGQGGIVELLDALDAITDARLRELELRAAVAEAELDVRRAAVGH